MSSWTSPTKMPESYRAPLSPTAKRFTAIAKVVVVVAVVVFVVSVFRSSDDRWVGPDGRRVPDGHDESASGMYPLTIDLQSGSAHCDLQDTKFLDVAWPLGTVINSYTSTNVREYVWDPSSGHSGLRLEGTAMAGVAAPLDARDTGYHKGGDRLWLAASDVDRYIYLQHRNGSFDRWPRATTVVGCS